MPGLALSTVKPSAVSPAKPGRTCQGVAAIAKAAPPAFKNPRLSMASPLVPRTQDGFLIPRWHAAFYALSHHSSFNGLSLLPQLRNTLRQNDLGVAMSGKIETVGVIGTGQMGSGIAHVCALAGYKVLIHDVSKERIESGLATIEGNMARQVSSKKITEADRGAATARISGAAALGDLADVDLAIESATENETVKRKIYAELCPNLKPEAVLATNTSSISITRLAAATDRPERFIGIHFMNPVPLMELVELVRGIATEDETFEQAKAFVDNLGKTVTVSEDFPAFIVNRILLPMINEAIYTLYEGVGSVEAIDKAMKLGAHHPMGPLELADFIGLDTCLSVMQVLHDGLADSKYRPCPLLVKYVEAGWLGRKTNRGFYDYRGEKPVPTR
jgi:3-hydroxybutyryl-CoA dehydrogenase